MATLYKNGHIPQHALDPIPAIGGNAWLLPIPAASFNSTVRECQRRFGWAPVVTSAGDGFRSYQRQVNVFLQRYEPRSSGGRDVRWWNGVRYVRVRGAAAAVPGTSNHGKGITVDVSGLGAFTSYRFGQFRDVAEAEGWSNAEGRSVGEPWHWNYTRTAYQVDNTNELPGVDFTLPDGWLPDGLIERDWFDMATEEDLRRIVSEEVAKRLDERQPRDRKDMLDQAAKANQAVIAEIRATPERVWEHDVPAGDALLKGKAGQLLMDARRAATEGRNAAIQVRDAARNGSPAEEVQ